MDASEHLVWQASFEHEQNEALWSRGMPPPVTTLECYKKFPPPSLHIYKVGNWPSSLSNCKLYIDGSGGKYASDRRLARVGWGIAVIDVTDPQNPEFLGGFYGSLDSNKQTVPRAELYAFIMAV